MGRIKYEVQVNERERSAPNMNFMHAFLKFELPVFILFGLFSRTKHHMWNGGKYAISVQNYESVSHLNYASWFFFVNKKSIKMIWFVISTRLPIRRAHFYTSIWPIKWPIKCFQRNVMSISRDRWKPFSKCKHIFDFSIWLAVKSIRWEKCVCLLYGRRKWTWQFENLSGSSRVRRQKSCKEERQTISWECN